jgi:DHA1 family inner membrane transport protein
LVAIAGLVPNSGQQEEAADWRQDLRAVLRAPLLLSLFTTILGFAGVFAVFTYIAPILVDVAKFPEAAVSPILLVFGGGLVVGNIIGGKLADHALAPALFGTLGALALVLALMSPALSSRGLMVLLTGLLGATGFATVAPLQMSVLGKADVGRDLASSLNIAAFNIGNAIGAWTGGIVIDRGPGLAFVPLVAALFPVAAVGIATLAAITPGPRSEIPLLSHSRSGSNANT